MYKPVILIGNGCRNNPILIEYLTSLGIPILVTWMAMDLIPENSPVFCGRPGIIGQRAANIIQQKADLLYCFGVRLDPGQIAYKYDNYAPSAKKIVYDVDKAELDKLPITWEKHNIDLSQLTQFPEITPDLKWLSWCKNLYNQFRPELESIATPKEFIDPYKFMSMLSDICTENDVIAPGSSGITAEVFMQTFKVKQGQKVNCVSTIGAMGADIPMAIGACLASGKKRTICVTGDGGFMLNVQELEVIKRLELPIKFFIFNNQGYGSVRVMQTGRFNNKVGCDTESGFTLPSVFDIADSYKISYSEINRWHNTDSLYNLWLFKDPYPIIYEVSIDPAFKQFPKVLSPNLVIDPMEDMSPKISNLKELMEWGNV